MLNKITKGEVKAAIGDVFSTDEDLYKNRYHGDIKTLDGAVDYAFSNLYNGGVLTNIDTYTYGNGSVQGFFSVNKKEKILRSFGIKKEYRQNGYNSLFWKSLSRVLGNEFEAVIWKENDRAKRFFVNNGAVLSAEDSNCLCYKFKKTCH